MNKKCKSYHEVDEKLKQQAAEKSSDVLGMTLATLVMYFLTSAALSYLMNETVDREWARSNVELSLGIIFGLPIIIGLSIFGVERLISLYYYNKYKKAER